MTAEVAERFWAKVEKSDSCWLWVAGRHNANGYGAYKYAGEGLAHRVSWTLTYGPVPADTCVLHRCDVPACVRPDHLFLGSRADNNRDRQAKGRSAVGDRHGFRINPDRIPRGTGNGKSVLTPEKVRNIRRRIEGGEPMTAIAADYSVGPSTVRAIKYGKSWAWLT